MPSRSDVSIPMASNTEIASMAKSAYPPRSSSYRVYSVIDAYAYGGDPGIQFSPTLEEPSYDRPTKVLDTIRQLRSDEPLSYEEIEDASESDLVAMAAMIDDEYDPFRQVSPVGFRQTKKQREQLIQRVYDNQISQKQIDEFVKVRTAIKEKALPPPPPPPPEKEKEKEKEEELVTKKRSDSALSVGKPFKVAKVGLPPTPSPRPKLVTETQNLGETKNATSSKPKEEVTFGTIRSISRQSKPPSLYLKRSNGSTAASISSTGSDSPASRISPAVPPLAKTRTATKQRDLPTQQKSLAEVTHDQHKGLTRRRTSSAKSLPILTSPLQDRPLPSLPEPTSLDNPGSPEDIEDDDEEMKRIKNLVVKRKPVRSDSNNTIIPTASNAINKENKPFYSSAPLLGQYFSSKINPSKANVVQDENQSPTVSTSTSKPDSGVASPSESVVQFPATKTASPATVSRETLGEIQSESDDSSGKAPSTPRPLLPSPSPVSHLESSPSKYAITKKSETTLKKNDKARERDQRRSVRLSGPEEFKNVAERLQQHFSNNVAENLLEESIAFRDNVLANEQELDKYIHPSMLPMTRSRPVATNAAKLGTIQLHCKANHALWFEHINGPPTFSTDCALCYISDETTRWQCCYCALRICTRCKDRVDKAMRSAPLQLKIDQSLADIMRMREERRAQMAMYSRPGSEESIYEQPEDAEMIPGPPTSMSMRSARSTGNLRSQPPYYGNMSMRPRIDGGGRRFSAGGGIPAPEDYPPPPRRVMPQQYLPPSPGRGRSPSRGGGAGYGGGYGEPAPQLRSGGPENRPERGGSPSVRLLGNGAGYVNARRERGERGLRQVETAGMRGAYPG